MAARRARPHRRGRRDRASCSDRPRQRRRVPRSGLRRPRQPLVGPRGPGHGRRASQGEPGGRISPGRPSRRWPTSAATCSRRWSRAAGQPAERTSRRRWRRRHGPSHAAPGRPVWRAGTPPSQHRGHRPRRRHARRARRGRLGLARAAARPASGGRGLQPAPSRARAEATYAAWHEALGRSRHWLPSRPRTCTDP